MRKLLRALTIFSWEARRISSREFYLVAEPYRTNRAARNASKRCFATRYQFSWGYPTALLTLTIIIEVGKRDRFL